MIYVTRAIVIHRNCVLTAQRPDTMSLPFTWELPGGKMESDETPEECIVRETQEELGLQVRVIGQLPPVDRKFRGKHYRMVPMLCEWIGGTLEVHEHAQAGWWPLHRIYELDWAPAERKVMEQYIQTHPLGLVESAMTNAQARVKQAKVLA